MHHILMPQITETMRTGTVRRWRKAPGQRVDKGELLLEIETEDGLAQVASSVSGVLHEILVPVGKTVKAQTVLAILDKNEKNGNAITMPESSQSMTKPSNMSNATVIPILMPQAGQSMEEGTILKWRAQIGETIQQGQIIFDVETDKATVEVEAVDSGRLARIVVPEGATVAVKKPVAYLAASDADVDGYIATHKEKSAENKSAAAVGDETVEVAIIGSNSIENTSVISISSDEIAPQASCQHSITKSGRVHASPAARKIAHERKINLAAIDKGSGPNGRIISLDVLAFQPSASAISSSAKDSKGIIRHRMSKMRRAIAASLQASKQNIPHFYERLTIVADSLLAFYRARKPKDDCSLNDVITLACARAIAEFPAFRSRLDRDELIESPAVNIGIAVSIANGLVVPVLLGAERMTLMEVASNTKRIVAAARAGKLEGVGHGNFTITNLGMFGVEEFAAIINPPEAAILAVGAARESVIVKDGAMRVGNVMTMTISCDHRIIDGALAAKFLARLKEILESPEILK